MTRMHLISSAERCYIRGTTSFLKRYSAVELSANIISLMLKEVVAVVVMVMVVVCGIN